METFSIIIPTYNSAKTLKYCLDSIESQTFPNFEILIMDGASSDSTLEIANQYHDERIRIYSEIDKGIYDAMNKGIKLSKGEWIYFLGSDDKLFSKETLSLVFSCIKDSCLDVVYGNVCSNYLGDEYDGEFDAKKIRVQNICHQSIFIKKSVFDRLGLFNLKYNVLADWDYNLRWFLNSEIKNKHLKCTIAEYADGGLSATKYDRQFEYDIKWNYYYYSRLLYSKSEKVKILFTEFKSCLKHGQRTFLKQWVYLFYSFIFK